MMRAIVFDFDGVIVDSEPLHWRAFERVLGPLGFECNYSTYLRKYVGFGDRDMIREWFAEQRRPLDEVRLDDLVAAKAQAFAKVASEGARPYAGAVELIEQASQAMPIAVCSGAVRSDIDLILPALGDGSLLERFAAIVTADDVDRSKPDPTCYRMAAERLGMTGGVCLAIEDTAAGLQAARDAGMQTLGVAHTHPREELNADHVVNELAEVTLDKLRTWYG